MAVVGRSSDVHGAPHVAGRTAQGVPVLGWVPGVGVPPVAVGRWEVGGAPEHATRGTHAHDFLVLLYRESGEGVLRVDDRDHHVGEGDAFLVAPGAVVTSAAARVPAGTVTWSVVFPADAVTAGAPGALVTWRGNPLLAPFGHRTGGGQRLRIPEGERTAWLGHLADLRDELEHRHDGWTEAVRAHLTLLLVALGRLDRDAPFTVAAEPLLAAVFDVVEARYAEPISLADVAAAVAQSEGHLTTVVRRRTGRTVGQWITERRMREARRLLADTDLTVGEVAGRVGYRDPGYFTRRFRAEHGVAPGEWRRPDR